MERDSLYQLRTFADYVPDAAAPPSRAEGPEGPTFRIEHRLTAGRPRRLAAVDAAE